MGWEAGCLYRIKPWHRAQGWPGDGARVTGHAVEHFQGREPRPLRLADVVRGWGWGAAGRLPQASTVIPTCEGVIVTQTRVWWCFEGQGPRW